MEDVPGSAQSEHCEINSAKDACTKSIAEVESHRNHLLQHLVRWLNVQHIGFIDHGPNPSASTRSSTAIVTSWCQGTFQFASGILSNRMPRTGENRSPRTGATNAGPLPSAPVPSPPVTRPASCEQQRSHPACAPIRVADVLQRGQQVLYDRRGQHTSENGEAVGLDCGSDLCDGDHGVILGSAVG